jgi:hypothetical protein
MYPKWQDQRIALRGPAGTAYYVRLRIVIVYTVRGNHHVEASINVRGEVEPPEEPQKPIIEDATLNTKDGSECGDEPDASIALIWIGGSRVIANPSACFGKQESRLQSVLVVLDTHTRQVRPMWWSATCLPQAHESAIDARRATRTKCGNNAEGTPDRGDHLVEVQYHNGVWHDKVPFAGHRPCPSPSGLAKLRHANCRPPVTTNMTKPPEELSHIMALMRRSDAPVPFRAIQWERRRCRTFDGFGWLGSCRWVAGRGPPCVNTCEHVSLALFAFLMARI